LLYEEKIKIREEGGKKVLNQNELEANSSNVSSDIKLTTPMDSLVSSILRFCVRE
jgi:hypothetical protein